MGGTPLKIILFREDKKLRSHAVKHLTDALEYEDSWGSLVAMTFQQINKCSETLRDLGCLYFTIQCANPPCNRCHSFTQCSPLVSALENEYLNAVEKAIKEAGSIPRYACFLTRSDASSHCWILPNRKLVAMAVLQGDTYNLMTCFNPKRKEPWTEMRDYCRRELSRDAIGYSIIWCREDTWGLPASSYDFYALQSEKPKSPKRPYFKRSHGGDWRRYLEDAFT
jgi:hypothetical protein